MMKHTSPWRSAGPLVLLACVAMTGCGGLRNLVPEQETAVQMRVQAGGSAFEIQASRPLADCRMQVNDAYLAEIGLLPEGGPRVIQASSFSKADGTRLDPRTIRIDQVALTCEGGRVSNFWILNSEMITREEKARRVTEGAATAAALGLEPLSLERDPLIQRLLQENEALRKRVERLEQALGASQGRPPAR